MYLLSVIMSVACVLLLSTVLSGVSVFGVGDYVSVIIKLGGCYLKQTFY
jgi:hypothetical protein